MHDGTLNNKYLVERSDGQQRSEARYFVLNYAKDPYARAALLTYANECAQTHPTLASDLRAVVAYYTAKDNRRRNDLPLRGTHGAGGEPWGDDDLLEIVERRTKTDQEFNARLQQLLQSL